MLNMHIQRNCHAQLQTGPKPLKSEAPAFSVVWFLNFGMLRYVSTQKLLFTRPRWPIPKTMQPARSSDAARPWLGTKFNSTHISAKMDFELLGFSALHHQSPALLRMAWCQILGRPLFARLLFLTLWGPKKGPFFVILVRGLWQERLLATWLWLGKGAGLKF